MKLAMTFALLLIAAPIPFGFAQAKKKEAASVPEWGQFRGPNRDGLSPDTGLLKQWPASGPALAWKSTGFGGGFSSVVVAGKVLYTLGDTNGAACLIAWYFPCDPHSSIRIRSACSSTG